MVEQVPAYVIRSGLILLFLVAILAPQSLALATSLQIPHPSIAQPRLLSSEPLVLARLRPGGSGSGLIEQLAALDRVRAGRILPIDYVADGASERLLAIVPQRDDASFASSGLRYERLDAEADTARYYAVTVPDGVDLNGEPWLD